MDLFTRSDLRELLKDHQGPCVSLYMPTRRGGGKEDPIVFRNLLANAQIQLETLGFPPAEAKKFLSPLQNLGDDATFWPNQSDGLAIYLARDFQRIYRLPWTFHEMIEVKTVFQVAPVLSLLQGEGRYFVLAVSQNHIRLYQGTKFTFTPIDLKGLPKNLAEALLTHDRDEVLTFHTRPTSGGSWGAIFEGHGVGIDDAKDNLLRYFQRIDAGLHPLLKEEKAPLLLAAVDYFHPIFREACSYPHLLEKGIMGSPDRIPEKELHHRSWELIKPFFQETRRDAYKNYTRASTANKVSTYPSDILPGAYRGEIDVLFIAEDKHLWGVVDPAWKNLSLHESPQQGDEDLSNLAAILTLRHGNAVHVLPSAEMPTGSPMAGIYHLPLQKH